MPPCTVSTSACASWHWSPTQQARQVSTRPSRRKAARRTWLTWRSLKAYQFQHQTTTLFKSMDQNVLSSVYQRHTRTQARVRLPPCPSCTYMSTSVPARRESRAIRAEKQCAAPYYCCLYSELSMRQKKCCCEVLGHAKLS